MVNKKGQNSTIAITIAIVLGIALIVFLIWGFSTNWSMFSGTSSVYTGKSNLDSVEQACEIKCQNGQDVGYCETEYQVKLSDGESVSKSCRELAEEGQITVDCPENFCGELTSPEE